MRTRIALLLGTLPLVAFVACSVYDTSLLGTGGATGTVASTTADSTTASAMTTTSATATSGAGGDMSTGAGGDPSTGSGGAQPCTGVGDCPGVDTECKKRTCDGGVCGFSFTLAGTPLTAQPPKDCLKAVCDGAGVTKTIADDLDLPTDSNDCTDDTCALGIPTFTPRPAGSMCAMGGQRCTADAKCVACVANADCASMVCDLAAHTCLLASCGDAVKNGAETDLNCGGGVCPPCATGKTCGGGSDCVGGVCTGSVCAPTCTDGVKNNAETATDCGGPSCGKCDIGKACSGSSDCKTNSCVGLVCACNNDHLLISEVRTRGAAGGADEFIELYNPTSASVLLDATWTIEARSTTSTTYSVRWTAGIGTILPSHAHYLVANNGYTQAPAKDGSSGSTGITDASSVVLKHAGLVVDAVCFGFSAATRATLMGAGYICEGTPADNLPHNNAGGVGDADVSIQRLPGGGLGNCIDTDDNAADFIKTMPAQPESLASKPTP